jgi:hypothetical protein
MCDACMYVSDVWTGVLASVCLCLQACLCVIVVCSFPKCQYDGSAWDRYNHLVVVFANSPLNGWLSDCVVLYLTEGFLYNVKQKRREGAGRARRNKKKREKQQVAQAFTLILFGFISKKVEVHVPIPAALARHWPIFARDVWFVRKIMLQCVASVVFFLPIFFTHLLGSLAVFAPVTLAFVLLVVFPASYVVAAADAAHDSTRRSVRVWWCAELPLWRLKASKRMVVLGLATACVPVLFQIMSNYAVLFLYGFGPGAWGDTLTTEFNMRSTDCYFLDRQGGIASVLSRFQWL